MSISLEEAKKEATRELRFEIGNLPHLGEAEYDEERGGYVFPIKFTKPDIPDLEAGEEDVEFYQARQIGEMLVKDNGEIERTPNEELEEEIRELNQLAEDGKLEKLNDWERENNK